MAFIKIEDAKNRGLEEGLMSTGIFLKIVPSEFVSVQKEGLLSSYKTAYVEPLPRTRNYQFLRLCGLRCSP